MDEIVKQAMAKWPNVPHCYDWLALDARGSWRMRGDRLSNAALVGFINRNYLRDERGCWYFQNGPQRVYIILEATPYIARTDPAAGFVLHTGQPLGAVEHAFMTEDGAVILQAGELIAQVDDRDVASVLALLELECAPASDDALMSWLDGSDGAMTLLLGARRITVERIASGDVPARFQFTRQPKPK